LDAATDATATEAAATPESPEGGVPSRSPQQLHWRRRLVLVLVVVTCFGVLASTVAVWTHRTLLNTDQWVDTVGPVASDPDVQAALTNYLTTQVFSVIDAQGLLQEALPDRVSFLAQPMSSAIQQFVHDTIAKLLATDQFQNLWVGINRIGHQVVVNVLRGDTRLVQTANGTVAINTLPVLARALQAVAQRVPGLFDDRPIPTDITFDTPADQARQELSAALGRDLPPDFGVFTLFQSDQLAAAQNAVELFDRGVWALVIVTILCGIAAIVLSVRRRRTILQIGIGVVLGMGIAVGLIAAVKNLVLNLIIDPTNRAAAAATLSRVVDSFNVWARALLVLGLIAALGAFLTGDHPWAKGLRHLVSRAGGTAGAKAASAYRNRGGQPFPWVAKHRGELAVAGAAIAVLWLFLADVTLGLLVVVLVLLALYELGIYALSGRPSLTDDDADGPAVDGADGQSLVPPGPPDLPAVS
jgi:hypothetical protein